MQPASIDFNLTWHVSVSPRMKNRRSVQRRGLVEHKGILKKAILWTREHSLTNDYHSKAEKTLGPQTPHFSETVGSKMSIYQEDGCVLCYNYLSILAEKVLPEM